MTSAMMATSAARKLLILFWIWNKASSSAQSYSSLTQKARVSCNAAYSAPCARTNSFWLANHVATELYNKAATNGGTLSSAVLKEVSDGNYNEDTGFYPFIVDGDTSVLLAHGCNLDFVGLTVEAVFNKVGLGFSDAANLHSRFVEAAKKGGDWVQYLWYDGKRINSKLAYVTNITSPYYVGVGYENQQLPPDTPCSNKTDSWCSINNARSLVGKAQFELNVARSIERFEQTVFGLSFDQEEYRIEGGFYTFMYNYDGTLKSHAVLHDSFGLTLSEVVVDKELGSSREGSELHQTFIAAAEGENDGWVQYPWRNILHEDMYTKVAFITKIVFENDEYYLGVGFNFARRESLPGPFDEPCPHNVNLPCAFRTSLDLSSHGLVHAISSPLDQPAAIFDGWSNDDQFKEGGYYLFAYDFNSTCVAHGQTPGNVGKTLREIFSEKNITLNASALHETFRKAAETGGGWVLYDWHYPETPNSGFQKIAYIFQMTLDGRDYYGGIGFENRMGQTEPYLDEKYRKQDNSLIECQPDLGYDCSEINAQALLGQAIADLNLATSQASVTVANQSVQSVQQTLDAISRQDLRYRVNGFHVKVFSVDGSECETNDNSGCLIADGSDPNTRDGSSNGTVPTLIGKTWQEILNNFDVTSETGISLHQRLQLQANKDGGVEEYQWLQGGSGTTIITKRAWAARYQFQDRQFYVVSEYDKSSTPNTCKVCTNTFDCESNCADGNECTAPSQSFCEKEIIGPGTPFQRKAAFLVPLILLSLLIPAVVVFFHIRSKQNKAKHKKRLEVMARKLESQMQGIVEVKYDFPVQTAEEYQKKLEEGSKPHVAWYFEEGQSNLAMRDQKLILPGTNFVQYMPRDVSSQIEHAHQAWLKGEGFPTYDLDLTGKIQKQHNAHTGLRYKLTFSTEDTMTQHNASSGHSRRIHREEVDVCIDSNALQQLPELPDNLISQAARPARNAGSESSGDDGMDPNGADGDTENILPLIKGQVIQIMRRDEDNQHWAFGNVLYDPLLQSAIDSTQTESSNLNVILSRALHGRPTSGWFPTTLTEPGDLQVMQQLLSTMGDDGSKTLEPPKDWEIPEAAGGAAADIGVRRVVVDKSSPEYKEATDYFMDALYSQNKSFEVTKLERIQNLSLWQTYSVKKATIELRFEKFPHHRVNNTDGAPKEAVERRWLFHGTTDAIIPKIVAQGFNRSFAGRNAVAYGRGVYFARDAAYSCDSTYSQPDKKNIQRMFMCRVAVGDWSKGTVDQLTPDPNPNNVMENFDSTVDNVWNPSVFVAFADAQAYPEYLISFTEV